MGEVIGVMALNGFHYGIHLGYGGIGGMKKLLHSLRTSNNVPTKDKAGTN
jgi:hypothetical protein